MIYSKFSINGTIGLARTTVAVSIECRANAEK